MMLLVADMQDLKADPKLPAVGAVIEARLDRGRGPVVSVLVQNGTLKIGNTVVCGTTYGKVRAMIDSNGKNVVSAGPSIAVSVMGFMDVPNAGDSIQVVDEKLMQTNC
jgi:translation initiation factor IF-2